ncbi:MAG: hypothetical protein Q7K65_02445 [Candidatus Buchananbacteria bacterium]|nr:hypothetical protein [Candidatus Buchananbacteria bacterium]
MEEQNQQQFNPIGKGSINIWLAVIISVVITAVLFGGGVYFWQKTIIDRNNVSYRFLQNKINGLQILLLESQKELSEKTDQDNSDQSIGGNSTITGIDQTWDLYTNNDLGFSLKIPKTISNVNTPSEKITIIESENVVYVTYKTSYDYNDILTRSAGNLSDIDKTKGIQWGIMVRTVNNDLELSSLIKSRYGSGCSIGSKSKIGSYDTYDVRVNGDGLDLEKSNCHINFRFVIRYSPTLKRAAIWDLGQSFLFMTYDENNNTDAYTTFDDEMADSFKFIQ